MPLSNSFYSICRLRFYRTLKNLWWSFFLQSQLAEKNVKVDQHEHRAGSIL